MTYHRTCAVVTILALCAIGTLQAQTDEIREATGLPIAIGQPVIFGQVSFRGLSPGEKKPTVNVALLFGGSQVDRMDTNDRGFFYFLREAVNGAVLVFELNNIEIHRQVLMANLGNRVRQDIEVDWRMFQKSPSSDPAAITVKDIYARSTENEKLFSRALAASKAKDTARAAQLFKDLLDQDPKDFVAWTELGTSYFAEGKLVEAEGAYRKAIDLSPKFMVALMNLGRLQLVQKQPNRAILTFTQAIHADHRSADAFHYLGESYLQIKLGSKAAIALNEAIRLAPLEKADLHLRLAALYHAAGARDLAAKEYKLMLEKKPQHPDREKLQKYIRENLR